MMEIIHKLKGIEINFEDSDSYQEKRLIRAKIEEFTALSILLKGGPMMEKKINQMKNTDIETLRLCCEMVHKDKWKRKLRMLVLDYLKGGL